MTPQQAWQATAKAEAPRPTRARFTAPAPRRRPTRTTPAPDPADLPVGTSLRRLSTAGNFMLEKVIYNVGLQHRREEVLIVANDTKVTVVDLNGEILIEHARPAPGITYVGNGLPSGQRPKNPDSSPKS
jgi:putative transposase